MKQQSAIRWIQEALQHTILTHEQVMQTIGLFEQAIDMEKEQIIKAWDDAYEKGLRTRMEKISNPVGDAEQYYKSKYELYNEEDEPNEPEVKGKIINIRAAIYKKILNRK